jgi:anaerobic selenocysteine-containing dehydrogenase
MSPLVRTACNRDCPDACGLLVTVENGRAVRLLAAREQYGPSAIMHYRSGGSLGLLKALADLLFERFGPVTIKRGDICSGAGEAAQELDFGQAESHDLFDLLNSKVIVLWGKDPHTSGVHLLPVLRDAAKRGCTIVGIDPLRTRAAELCDLFIQPRPGGDGALALCVAAVLLERGWVDENLDAWSDGAAGFSELARSRSPRGWAARADVPWDAALKLAETYGQGSDEYPLILLATSTPKAQSSQWSVEPQPGPPPARVHPDVAGLHGGSAVRLVSRLGALPVRLVADDRLRADMVVMAKGGMQRDGHCANVLISAIETDAGGGAAYNDEPVRIEALG